MRKRQMRARGQGGFTLIEIIAVLVILGILAVVAIPKYFDMQNTARQKAAYGLVASAQSQLSLAYANSKLNGTTFGCATECTNLSGTIGNSSEQGTVSCTDADPSNITATVNSVTVHGNWYSPDSSAS